MTVRSLLAVFALSLALPVLASAQDEARDMRRATLFTGGGFGGRETLTPHGPSAFQIDNAIGQSPASNLLNPNVDATPLVGVRLESALHRFFVLGGQFRAAFWRNQGMPSDLSHRNSLFDFDVTAKARCAFRIKNVVLEPYALVPVGFTLAVWNDSIFPSGPGGAGFPGLSGGGNVPSGFGKPMLGWNIGGFAGLTVLTRSGWGGMIELGVMHHAGYEKDDYGGRWSLTLTQFTLQAGPTYAF